MEARREAILNELKEITQFTKGNVEKATRRVISDLITLDLIRRTGRAVFKITPRAETFIKINKEKDKGTSEGKLFLSAIFWEFRLAEPIINVLKNANAYDTSNALTSEEISKRITEEFVRINPFVCDKTLKALVNLKILGKTEDKYFVADTN